MSENYIEIQVNIYVDKSILLKDRFSEDAKVIDVRDAIGFNDEFLMQRNTFALKRKHEENKSIQQDKNNHGIKPPPPRKCSLFKTERTRDKKRTPNRKYSCEASVVCQKSEAKSDKSTANTSLFKDNRDDTVSPVIFSQENLDTVRYVDSSVSSGMNPVKFMSSDNFENKTSFISQTNLVENDVESSPAFESENTTSDSDESSSGIYTDDENYDMLDKIQYTELIEEKISYFNNEENKTNSKCTHTRCNEQITESDFSNTNNFLIKDISQIQSEINVNTREPCSDLLNSILDRIELKENFQRVDKSKDLLRLVSTDIKSCPKCTHETVTGGTICCLQGIEYTTDKPHHDYSSKIDTKYCTDSRLPATKLEIKTFKITSSNSCAVLKTNKDHNSSFAEAKTANAFLQNVIPTEKMETDIVDNSTSHNGNCAAKLEQTFKVLGNNASVESSSAKINKSPDISKLNKCQTGELFDYIASTKGKCQSHNINKTIDNHGVTLNVNESTPDDLEPGEIPDDIEISTKAYVKGSPKYSHKEKHSSVKHYNFRYFSNRHSIKNLRLFGARPFNTDLEYLRFQRRTFLPRRELKTKRIIYNWSDYTKGNDSLQKDGDNRSPIHRHDLRNRIEANDHREYIGYERRLQTSYGSTYFDSRKPLPPRTLYQRERDSRKPLPPRTRYQTERYQETDYFKGNISHDVYQSHRNENSFLYDLNSEKMNNNIRRRSNTPNRPKDRHSRYRYRRSSYDRREKTDGKEHKYTNFKITSRFSSGDEISRPERSNISTGSNRNAPLKKTHRANSETVESGHEEKMKSSHKIKLSRQSLSEEKPRLSKRRSETSTKCDSKESRKDKSNLCTEDKITPQNKSRIVSSRSHKTTISPNESEQKLTSIVTIVSSSILYSTETSSNTVIDSEHLEEKSQLCVIKDNQAHLKCFEIIRDLAFKKAVHHSDANWDKYSKLKFVFEDELIQQLERNYSRYLYSANDMKLQSKAIGPLPRFASDELMTAAIVDTWKQPQIIASCDRQYREFDDIIGYVGYNIPCFWCEMVFADGKFVCAFPVLDPIGHRDDTMYCQDDQ